MIMMEMNDENVKPTTTHPEITLPLFVWLAITTRAAALHNGDITKCCQEIFEAGIRRCIEFHGMAIVPPPEVAPETPNQNCPGGSA